MGGGGERERCGRGGEGEDAPLASGGWTPLPGRAVFITV